MSVTAVCVDRARTIRKVRSETRIEGGYDKVPTYGPWFKCRYDPGNEDEARDQARTRRNRPATILYPTKDLQGAPIDVRGADELEVVSAELTGGSIRDLADGTAAQPNALRLLVSGDPDPLRRKRSVLGYEVRVARVRG